MKLNSQHFCHQDKITRKTEVQVASQLSRLNFMEGKNSILQTSMIKMWKSSSGGNFNSKDLFTLKRTIKELIRHIQVSCRTHTSFCHLPIKRHRRLMRLQAIISRRNKCQKNNNTVRTRHENKNIHNTSTKSFRQSIPSSQSCAEVFEAIFALTTKIL